MEKIMSKTNDTSNLGDGTLDDHGMLADSELDAATGGMLYLGGGGSDLSACAVNGDALSACLGMFRLTLPEGKTPTP
jgi:hypothetical protein